MNEKYNIFGRISAYFIDRYRTVYLLLIIVFLLGYRTFQDLPRERTPEISMPFVNISTRYTGVAPEDMEALVTNVIEEAVSGIEGVNEVTSTTSLGNSAVRVQFDDDIDMEKAEADLRAEISNIRGRLPDEASDPSLRFRNSVDRPIMGITIAGDYSLAELKNYGELLEEKILAIEGVSETELSGGLDRVINIYIDEEKLDMYGISLNSVSQSIRDANRELPVGSTELDTLEYSIRFTGKISSLDDIENVIVGMIQGYPLYLKDVAEIKDEYAEPSSVSRRYDSNLQSEKKMVPTISLSVQREPGADVIKASNEIKRIIAEGKGDFYPEDVNFIITNEDAAQVNKALNDVLSNALSGLLLVIVVLFIFIGFKESIIVAFVIPVSLLISFMFMKMYGITLNTMSMVALILALGMLVDNAIVIMENIDRIRDEGRGIIYSAKFATNQVAPAVFSATLTTISAFIPLAMAEGMMARFMAVIPYVVIFAIGASFAVSIVVTPALCSRFLSNERSTKKTHIITKISSVILVIALSAYAFKGSFAMWAAIILFGAGITIKMFFSKNTEGSGHGAIIENYGKILKRIISKKRNMAVFLSACLIVVLLSLNMLASGRLKIELRPQQDSTTLEVSANMPIGYLLEDSLKVAEQMEGPLYKYPEILNIVSRVTSSQARFTIEIIEESQRNISSTELIDKLRNDMKGITGAKLNVGQRTRGFMGSAYPIRVQIIGEDSDTVAKVSEDLMEILKQVEGTADVSSSLTGGPPEIHIDVDEEKAAVYGIDASVIASTINRKISGVNAEDLVIDGEEVEINILLSEDTINSISDFKNITFKAKNGTTVYFNQIAELSETKGLIRISHENLQRVETVQSSLLDGYNGPEVLKVFQTAVDNYDMPKNVTIEYTGEMRNIRESFISLGISMIFAVILVFIILSVQFNSLSQPIIILCAVPLAAIGAIWGLIITGNNFSTYAFFGIVSLVGIAINDAIVLVDFINYLRLEGHDIIHAIIEGGKTRFVPVFSTTITTIGGILPLAIRDREYAQLGYSLIFGLLVATVLTLIVIPSLYLILESGKSKIMKVVPILKNER